MQNIIHCIQKTDDYIGAIPHDYQEMLPSAVGRGLLQEDI
jgi:hypothetical protein